MYKENATWQCVNVYDVAGSMEDMRRLELTTGQVTLEINNSTHTEQAMSGRSSLSA